MARRDHTGNTPEQPSPPLLMVGIGASAGGQDALRAFFSSMPADADMAFVLVQQRIPERLPLHPRLLRDHLALPVEEARDGIPVQRSRLYVAPPGHTASVVDGVLHVEALRGDGNRPIDAFFHSLAESCRNRAVAVLLSSAGSDGALGLQAIGAGGGMTLAENSARPGYERVQQSAVATGMVDHVLPAAKMAPVLVAYAQCLHRMAPAGKGELLSQELVEVLDEVATILQQETNHDFRYYESHSLVSRLQRRMLVLQLASVEAYLQRLRQDRDEARALFHDLLIGVTAFFREAEPFAALRRQVIAPLLRKRASTDPIRVWVPGCATGEEVYSIAMLLVDEINQLGQAEAAPRVQIFATDIDDHALKIARQGAYPLGIAKDISAERLARFFVKRGDRYWVTNELRSLCLFSHHNLINDPPFSRLDLVSCRNVLVYMDASLQHKLMPLFHFALRPGGYLFLDSSERMSCHPELFQTVDAKHRISQRRPIAVSPGEQLARTGSPWLASLSRPEAPSPPSPITLDQVAQRVILDELAPRYAVINHDGEILSLASKAGKYVEHPVGAPGNIITLARPSLRKALRSALGEALQTRRKVVHADVPVQTIQGVQPVTISVQPMPAMGAGSKLFLVIFQDTGPLRAQAPAAASPSDAQSGQLGDPVSDRIAALERELASTRAELARTVQELETSNEELQLINGDLHAANEELEVSKEELQTTNEALSQSNSRLESLLISTRIATMSLDEDLRIQSFSPAAVEVYNLLPGDVGRPIAHITHRAVAMPPLPTPEAMERMGGIIEHQVQTTDGRWYMRRVLPFRPLEGRRTGLVVTFVDITACKQAEMGLRESEQRLRVALGKTPMSVFQCDRELRFVWQANAHPEWPQEHLLGRRADEILPSPQGARLVAAQQHVLDTGQGTRQEMWLETSAGRQVWELAIEPLREDGGAVIGLTVAALEITQRKQVEEALRDREARLRLALEAGRMGAWEWNIQTNEVVWSRSIYEQLGVSTTVDRPTSETFFESIHSADLPGLQQALARAIDGDDEYEVEFRVARPDGTIRWFLGKGAVFRDKDGTPVRMHGVLFDNTERKLAEDRVQRIFEQAAVGIALITEDGSWVQANRRLCQILGYAWDDLRQMGMHDLIHPADIEPLRAHFREMLDGRRETFSMEARHPRKDGTLVWGHISASFIDPSVVDRVFVTVVEDITARKHSEQAIEEAARHKDQFLAMLGHELRNPLAAIRNAVELQRVLDVAHSSSLTRARDVIERQTTHMARLIDDLLDVSRIGRGKVQLEKVTLDLAELVTTVAADHHDGIVKVGLVLDVEAPGAPIWVKGDPTRLAQVVGNLLDNAAKFTPPPGTITVRMAQQSGSATIEVRDTGIGIEPGMRERIFEVFQQASSAADHSPGGLGLGLSLVQGLLALHDGTIEAHSEGPGTGASFLVRLPTSEPVSSQAQALAGATMTDAPLRILVVDDNRDSAEILRDVLELAGHQVAVAYDGAEAVSLADRFRPDTVICDIGLPGGMTGYDVARALRRHARLASAHLIAMTGYGRNEDRARAHEAGFDHHLTKPVTLARLRQVLDRPAARRPEAR